jgi:hypothetical protein
MPTSQNAVEMVTHHRISEHFDPHDARQKFQPIPNEFPPMFIVFAGEFILPAQKRSANTPIDAMHDLNLTIRQHIPPIRTCHDQSPRISTNQPCRMENEIPACP